LPVRLTEKLLIIGKIKRFFSQFIYFLLSRGGILILKNQSMIITKKYKILGVVPARGGSKGIPQKNIKLLLGKPLIAYTIIEALKSKLLTKVIISSDDRKIIRIVKKYGGEAPFVRPKELATDKSLALPVIQHAVRKMEKIEKIKYDYVVMLQPTTPLRTAEDIDQALKKLIKTKADSVISVVNVEANHPWRMKKIVNDRLVDYGKEEVENMPRQSLPPVYIRSGDIYAVKRKVLMADNTFRGKDCRPYLMSEGGTVNIDSEIDFKLAEILLSKRKKDVRNFSS